MRLQLTGAENILQDRISATVRAKTKDQRDLFLPATSVVVGKDGRSATITFPSIQALLKDNVEKTYVEVIHNAGVRNWQSQADARVAIWYPRKASSQQTQTAALGPAVPATDPGLGNRPDELPISYFGPVEEEKKKAPEKAKFSLTTSTSVIVARKGEGSVNIALEHVEKSATFPMFFEVTGGDVENIAPPLTRKKADLFATADGVYRLALENLIVGTPVVIRSWQLDPKDGKTEIEGDKITLEVRAQ